MSRTVRFSFIGLKSPREAHFVWTSSTKSLSQGFRTQCEFWNQSFWESFYRDCMWINVCCDKRPQQFRCLCVFCRISNVLHHGTLHWLLKFQSVDLTGMSLGQSRRLSIFAGTRNSVLSLMWNASRGWVKKHRLGVRNLFTITDRMNWPLSLSARKLIFSKILPLSNCEEEWLLLT